mmetsp:Transcript_14985/g.18810  ORF Transcript_14985/g.18810 Transcript_14985/m.18810 type:complete len:653 (+) Transcript_14985:77-2035(+)
MAAVRQQSRSSMSSEPVRNHSRRKHVHSSHVKSCPLILCALYSIVTSAILSVTSTHAIEDSTSSLRRQSHRRATIPGEVVWILSYVHSAGDFTERLINAITQDNPAERNDHESFILDPERPDTEDDFVVTRSHCGGVCLSECTPNQYVLAPDGFLDQCVEHASFRGELDLRLDVDDLRRGRVVHMVRDPFSTAAAGYIYEWNVHRKANNEEWLLHHSKDSEGFIKWCTEMDMRNKESEGVTFDVKTNTLLEGVPCHTEIFKWVQWHNNAFIIEEQLSLKVLVVHQEDYSSNSGVVDNILQFLGRNQVGEAPVFGTENVIGFYSTEEQEKIVKFIKQIASEKTWNESKNYFKDVIAEITYDVELGSLRGSQEVSGMYELASKQSFGFFNDIPEDAWKRKQNMMKEHVSHWQPSNPLAKFPQGHVNWYAFNYEPNFNCPYERRVGGNGNGDGPKWVCDPYRLKENSISRNAKTPDKPGCVIYSIGSNGDFSFELGMQNIVGKGTCDIHIFDMDNYEDRMPQELEATYHVWGLRGSKGNLPKTDDEGRVYYTLKETISMLGHEALEMIDVFKIDCEGCEFATFDEWFDPTIPMLQQILVEVHRPPADKALQFFDGMKSQGYATFHKEPNLLCLVMIEYAFIKLSNDFYLPSETSP